MTQVLRITNGVVTQAWRDVRSLAEFVSKYGLTGAEFVEVPDAVGTGWTVEGQGFAPPPPDPAAIAAEVRADRDARLRESDLEVLRLYLAENRPVPQEWRNYRQALRDLPEQANPSIPIIWPGKPRP